METFDSLLKALVGAVGIASGAAYVPQAVRIWKRRSSDDVSVVTYLLFLLGQVIWLTYGVRFGLLEIVLGMSANLAGNLSVILSALRFRTRTA
jgi:MtN3 and saliva related transmembrane protein